MSKKDSNQYTEDFMKWQNEQYLPHVHNSPTESLAKYVSGQTRGRSAKHAGLIVFTIIFMLLLTIIALSILSSY